jgi:multidrug efflux pump subunit AcrB/ABC-type multidrug transport system ATPase subunit
MNLIQFIIRRKTLVSMIFISLCLLGIVSYNQLATELLPSPELPVLFVQVSSVREVDPEYLEQKAIIPLEGVIGTLENIDRIEATADRRRGMIRIDYNEQANLKYAYLKLTERINAIRGTLPEEFTATVIKFDFEQLSNLLMVIQARGSGGVNRVRQVVDEKVLRELENIDGIANVDINGGQEKTVTITLNEPACEAQGLTPASIQQKIAQYHRDKKFLGYAYSQNQRVFVNSVSEYTQVSELENIVLKDNSQLRLRDVAGVYVGEKEQTTISRVNGKEAVTITLIRDSQINLIHLAQTTRKALEKINRLLVNDDVELVIQTDAAEVMEDNLNNIKKLALVGGLWAVLVLWFFLNNIQLVILIALAIPISILAAMNVFYAYDISINSLTLVGMALAVGMLLDNSIVVLENIYRLLSKRHSPDDAIIQGTSEVWRSILASTLTTIIVFLPFVFASNFLIRLIGKHISVSIVSTLLFSLIVALLLIPMAVHWLVRRQTAFRFDDFNVVSQKNRLVQIYTLLLKSSMRFPARTILGTMIVFFLSIIICFAVSLNTQEEVELDEINLYVTMPQGATLAQTDLIVTEVEKKLEDLPEKEDLVAKVYEEEATLTIKLKENYKDIQHRPVYEIKQEVNKRTEPIRTADIGFDAPQSSSRFRSSGGEGRGEAGLQRMLGIGSQSEKVVIKGHNFAMMQVLANDIRGLLEDLDAVQSANLNIRDDRPEIHLLFENLAFSYFNVSPAAVVNELATFESETTTGVKFKIGTEEYDIVLKSQELEEKNVTDLRRVSVPTNSGGVIDLDKISKLLYSSGSAGIVRINQEKQIEISYRFGSEINESKELLEDARLKVDQIVQSLEIPSGIAVEVLHDENELSEFYFLIGIAFVLIYMILASVFESLSTPVVMMFTIPLAAIGSLWGLILTGNSLLSANTLIGFLILLGIVVNNGIILIDYTRILRQRGYSVARSLLTAGQARLRPILITAITTIVAMVPLAMGQEEYVASVGAPFAITVIGGLTFSVLFTLIFIPTVYIGLEGALVWFRGLKWHIKLLHGILLLVGTWFIYFNIDSFIWKLINFSLLITIIPALTYFIQTSLRQAQSEIVPPADSIRIKFQHLVKVFDTDSRFVREWKAGREWSSPEHPGASRTLKALLQSLSWEILVWGFLIYFGYFYLEQKFWLFFLAVVVYFYTIWVMQPVFSYLRHRFPRRERWWRGIENAFYWLFPLFNGVLFYFRWEKLTGPIFIFILWYLGLFVHHTSMRVLRQKINVDALSGRFVTIRRTWYLLVKSIPVIGRKKQPFSALKGVSFEIGNGMFGLLGPNGAGKTTLMRAVCGILELSRGTISINGIKLSEKREELQGLIGYLPQEFGTYENMTATEFLEYQAMLKGIWEPAERAKIVQHVLSAVHLEERQHEKIGSFSGGMRQRVGIAQTLLHLPRILVVDEPTAGLDPRERIRFRNLLVELSRDRIVIFSTHIIEDISSSCNALAVLNRGEMKYLGTPEEMVNQARGVVWQVALDETEFEQVRSQLWVVHHIRDNGQIKVRFLAEKSAFASAKTVVPTLEDAYLWLLGQGALSIS